MGCQLEVVGQPYSADGAMVGTPYVPECPADCPGPNVSVESRAILFGKWFHIDRTVSVCPISGQEYVAPLIVDVMGLNNQPS